MSTVHVVFEDMTDSSYRFKPLSYSFIDWPVVPRVGELVLDANEFQYVVEQVIWYDAGQARVRIRRKG